MQKYKNYKEFSTKFIEEINTYIKDYFKNKKNSTEYNFVKEFIDDLEEYNLRPGKRIRSLLLILTYYGYSEQNDFNEDIVKIASVIELMHSFLLIQDDIIDNAELRRGAKSLHLLSDDKYQHLSYNPENGKNIATILADVNLFNALEILAESDIDLSLKNNFLKIFAHTYEMTAWGQLLDILNTMPKTIDTESEVPYQISTLKTSYYTICNPMIMGFLLAGKHDEHEKKAITEFSLPLGLAFQIRDDIIGIFSSKKNIGKSADSDLQEAKFTILIQQTIDLLEDKEKNHFISVFLKNDKTDEDVQLLRNIIETSGAKQKSINKMNDFIKKSREMLDKLSINKVQKNILDNIVDLIAEIK